MLGAYFTNVCPVVCGTRGPPEVLVIIGTGKTTVLKVLGLEKL